MQLSGGRCRSTALHEPRNPDAAFVKQAHRKPHRDQSQNIRRGRDDGSENKDEHDRVGPRARHEFVGDQSEVHQRQNHHRQFKCETEADGESRHERVILLHRPSRRPAKRLGVAEEEEDGFGQQPEITNQHAEQKEREADEDGREKETLLHRGERGENKFCREIEKQRKRKNEAGVKCEMKRDDDRVRDAERPQRANLWIDIVQRHLQHAHECRSKREANDHRQHERDRHLDDGPAQVLQMLEKRLRRLAFRKLAKFENVPQRH